MTLKSYDRLFKLLLIGDSGVGKTCLLFRYVDDTFTSTFISTIGIDFKIKTMEIEGKKIKLQIWDTAGQERFQTITASYYRGAMGIMLVYDVTERRTFENIQHWISQIQHLGSDDVVKVLVANKTDAPVKAVPSSEGSAEAAKHGIRFFETSAKNGDNVSYLFEELTKAILLKFPLRENENSKANQGQNIIDSSSTKSASCCGFT